MRDNFYAVPAKDWDRIFGRKVPDQFDPCVGCSHTRTKKNEKTSCQVHSKLVLQAGLKPLPEKEEDFYL